VILLLDEVIAHMREKVEIPDIEEVELLIENPLCLLKNIYLSTG